MPFSAFIGPALGLFGGMMAGDSARDAANTQAQASTNAANLAAQESSFRPVGITTRFGQSDFKYGIPGVRPPIPSDFPGDPQALTNAVNDYKARLQSEGRVIAAGYTLDPALKAYQDRFMGLAGAGLTQAEAAQKQFAPLGTAAQGLFTAGQQYLTQPADQRLGGIAGQYLGAQPDFGLGRIGGRLLGQGQDQQLTNIARQQFGPNAGANALTSLGQQYVAQSPQQAAQQFMSQQQDLLAPSRERQFAQLQNNLFQTGRGGLSVGATGARPSGAAGLGASSPELEAYFNAQAQQDAGLAAQAQQAGQQQSAFGAGLLSQGQALGQGQIGFGAGILSQQQAQEAQRLGLGSAFTAQQQALEQGRFGFGSDLLSRQQAADQRQQAFGAGLFGTGGNLLTAQYGGQSAALVPYEAYLQQMKSLESLGQQPLSLGMDIGASNRNPTGAEALLRGNMPSRESYQANAFNPFANLLISGSQNPAFRNITGSGIQSAFSQTGLGGSGFGTGLAYGNQDLGANY